MKKYFILRLALLISIGTSFAIEETPTKKSWFKREKNEVKLEKTKIPKRVKVEEIDLPAVTSMKKPLQNYITMSIEDCVASAISHNPTLNIAEQRIKAAQSGIGQQRANYAPRLTARVNYNHIANNGSRIINSHQDSIGFNNLSHVLINPTASVL